MWGRSRGGDNSAAGWLTSGCLPDPRPVSSQFIHLPYMTDAPPAAVLVAVPRVGGFAYVSEVSSTVPTLLGLQPEVMWLYFTGTGALGSEVWPGAGLAHFQGVPLIFIHHM